MEKKKLKKLRINKMQDFPVINEREQLALKGGDYTLGQMEQMMEIGDWTGGFVEGVGYVSGVMDSNGGYEVTETCAICDMETYGQMSDPGGATSAWLGLFHYLGAHDNIIIRDTTYNGY